MEILTALWTTFLFLRFTLPFNLFSLLNPYGIVAALGYLSAFGLLWRKGWGWELAIVQAASAILLLLTFVRTYYFLTPWGLSALVFALAGLITLFLALRPSVKEFASKKYATAMPKRALIGAIIGLAYGAVGLIVGGAIGQSPFGGGAVIAFSSFMIISGLLVAMGAVLVLLRKYTLGGVMIIIFSLFPLPQFYLLVALLWSLLPSIGIYNLALTTIAAIPIIAGVLALTSRPKIRN